MAVANTFALQEVFNLTIIDPSTDYLKCRLENLKTCNFTQDGTTVYATGGRGNPKIVGFDHSKSAMFSLGSALILANLFETQTGSAPVTGANTNFVYTDIVTVSSNAATTTFTPLGTAGAEIVNAFVLDSYNAGSTELTQGAVTSSGVFTLTGKALAFNSGDLADGTRVMLKYNATTYTDTVTYSSYTDVFSNHVKVVADGVVRACDGTDFECQLIFYNAKMNNSFSLETSADGDPAVYNLEVEALKNCVSTKLWDLIIYDLDTVV